MRETPRQVIGRIGRYELLARLGQGGMGEVFLARAKGAAGFEKTLVIKRILPHLADNPVFVQRLVDEGKLVARLRHAGIAQVYDLGADPAGLHLSMEYVDGRDLRALLRLMVNAGLNATPELVATILCAVLDALDYAHTLRAEDGAPLGIIHRDVTPSNIMVSRAGQVKLLDFGIARAHDSMHASLAGSIQGKFSYMSPEQAAGGALDARSDLFSVGVVAWELLAGFRPFDGETDLKTLDNIRHHDPGPFVQHCGEISDAFGAVIDRLLKKSPEARYKSAAEAGRDLKAWLVKQGSIVGERELAAWVTEVLDTLPSGLRDLPIGAISLDDALRLGLDEAPGAPSLSTRSLLLTPSAIVEEVGFAGTQPIAPALTPTSTVEHRQSHEEAAETGQASTLTTEVAPTQTRQEQLTRVVTPTVPPTGASSSSRPIFFFVLISMNVLLIALLVWFMARDSGLNSPDRGGGAPTKAGLSESADAFLSRQGGLTSSLGGDVGPRPEPAQGGARGRDALVTTNDTPETMANRVLNGQAKEADSDESGMHDSGGEGDRDTLDSQVSEMLELPLRDGDTGPVDTRSQGGSEAASSRKVVIRTQPSGATVLVTGYGSGPAPRTLWLEPGQTPKATISASGYRKKSLVLRAGKSKFRVQLQPAAYGYIEFRFHPANAEVFLDGKRIATHGKNRIRRKLSVGSHRLTLKDPKGGVVRRKFVIEADKTENLATIKVR